MFCRRCGRKAPACPQPRSDANGARSRRSCTASADSVFASLRWSATLAAKRLEHLDGRRQVIGHITEWSYPKQL